MHNVRKDFWKYISLSICGMLGSSGTILGDAFFVSDRLGADGLAAMNLAICMFGLMNGTGLLFGIGGATRYTILRSQGFTQKANSTFVLSFFAALAIGICYALTGAFFSRPIARLLGANADTLTMCNTYLKTVLCFAPAFILNHLLIAFVRHDGNPGLSMRAMTIGSLANIVLDYLFMYPLNMGIFGAAIATGMAALISMGISSLHSVSANNHLRFTWAKILPKEIAKIISPGIATFMTEFSSGIVLVVFNLLILRIAGNAGVAAYGIVANLALMVLALMNGVAHGVQPLISSMYGKNDNKTAKQLYDKGILLTFSVGCAIWGVASVFAPTLVGYFNGEGELLLQSLAENGVRLYFIGFLFVGYNYVTTAYFSATEKPRQAFAIALFRGFIGITAVACLLSAFFGMTGIWLAFPIVEIISILFGFFSGRKYAY